MDIRVEIVKENEDGSADALVHFDKDGLAILVQYGIIEMLKQAIAEYKMPVKTYTGGKPHRVKKETK
jgi:hypothetical protein